MSEILTASEYEALMAERDDKRRQFYARKLIADPQAHDPPQYRLLRGAMGRRSSTIFRKMVVQTDGHQRLQTVDTKLDPFMLTVVGAKHARDNK